MDNWQQKAERGDWKYIDHSNLPRADQVELLERLREVVPKEKIQNGMQVTYRYLEPNEIEDPNLREAATILSQGELEAELDVFFENSLHEWLHTQSRVLEAISSLSIDDEVTQGAEALSRSAHLKEVNSYLSITDSNFSRLNLPCSYYDIVNDRRSESEIAKEDFAAGLLLGMKISEHLQFAQGKDIEALAVEKLHNKTRLKSQAVAGGRKTASRFKELKRALNEFALSEKNSSRWLEKKPKETLRQFKKMASELELKTHNDVEFKTSSEKMLSDSWFQKCIDECRQDRRYNSLVLQRKTKLSDKS